MNSRTQAFTLVETVVAIAVLAVLGSMVVFFVLQGNRQMTGAIELDRASHLAEFYMEEVLATQHWDERSSSDGIAVPLAQASLGAEEATRSEYDDCDDYAGFTASSPHHFKDGTSIGTEYDVYTVTISTDYVDPRTLAPAGQPTDVKRIRVNVQWQQNQSLELISLLANL